MKDTPYIQTLMTKLPHSVGASAKISKASELMKTHKCSHLPVLDGGTIVGLISKHDIEKVEKLKDYGNIAVSEIMTDEPVVVEPNTSVGKTIKMMLDKKINSVIVHGTADQSWGIFTSTDALKYLVDIL